MMLHGCYYKIPRSAIFAWRLPRKECDTVALSSCNFGVVCLWYPSLSHGVSSVTYVTNAEWRDVACSLPVLNIVHGRTVMYETMVSGHKNRNCLLSTTEYARKSASGLDFKENKI